MKRVNIISTIVQRSQSGQRVPTGNTIVVEGGGNVDLDELKYEISKDFLKKKEEDVAEERITFKKGIAIGKEVIDAVSTWEDGTEPTDTAVPTNKRVEMRFLRKDKDDRSKGTIGSDKGFETGDFEPGLTGSGASMYRDGDGNTYVESDYLTIRKKATFTTITVQELKHIGGALVLSPASMVCIRVKELMDGYKCFFRQEDADGRKVYNEFEVGDQARCQTFTLERNVYYWRLVTEVGEDFIVLSKTDCDAGSDKPGAGDNISLLGSRNDKERQSAIVLSAYGADAPSYKQYRGVNSYSLEGKQVTKLSPDGNELSGVVNLEAGSTGVKNLKDFPDEVYKAVQIGAVNLLLNSGFTGDYVSVELEASTELAGGSEMFSPGMEHWTGKAVIVAEAEAVSGKCAVIGNLTQPVEVMKDEGYVVSFKAKGANVKVVLGGVQEERELTPEYVKYAVKMVSDGIGTFSISGDATVCDLQLERGTIATDWNASPYDNDKTLAEFQALKYIQDAIREGNTSILGGLILSSMVQLGNYKDGKMERVTAGMSGIYNHDEDVAFWGGGTFENAVKTITKFRENTRYRPTEKEWASMANFAVSHGGDVFLRGYVHALGGIFRGAVEIADGKIMLNDDGSGLLANGGIRWEKNGIMYRKATDVVVWNRDLFNYDAGSYFDVSTLFATSRPVVDIPTPPSDGYRICLALKDYLGSGSCIIRGYFRVNDLVNDAVFVANSISIYNWSSDEFWLTYNADLGYWQVESDRYSIEEGEVVLGLNGRTAVGGSVVDKESVSTSNIYAAESITVTGRSESSITTFGGLWVVGKAEIGGGLSVAGGVSATDASGFDRVYVWDYMEVFGPVTATGYKTFSNSGVSKEVTIKATDGTHVLKFDGGIFIGEEFTANS